MEFKPLPTKTRTSFDIPALLAHLEKQAFATTARFEDLLVVRNYMTRHKTPYNLNQTKVDGGYILTLRYRDAPV